MKLLASDYDGTLYFKDGYKKEDLEAIRKFQEEGNLFGLCSGRPLANLWSLQNEDLHFDFIVASSGACIAADPDHILDQQFVPREALERIVDQIGMQDLVVITKDHIYTTDLSCWAAANVAVEPVRLESVDQIDGQIVQMSIERPNEEEAVNVRDRIEHLALPCACYQNGTFLDIVAPGCSKATGIVDLAERLHIDREDVACIGDNYNDLPMIENIPNSFSFPYAPKKVQEKAGTIVGSVAEAIRILMK